MEWQNAYQELPQIVFGLGPDDIRSYWDEYATDYGNGPGMTSDLDRMIIDRLWMMDALNKETSVLDIGCGAGNFAIPFASLAKEVDALDISGVMLRSLTEQTARRQRSNISCINQSWESYKPCKKYGFVFSSFCPATSNYESLLKMESLAIDNCCIVTSAPGKIIDPYVELCREMTNKNVSNKAHDAAIIENVLTEMGRKPQIKIFSTVHNNTSSSANLERSLTDYIGHFTEMDISQRRLVKERAAQLAEKRERRTAHAAMILWKPLDAARDH